MDETTESPQPDESIAIIGMAGRFPGARNVDELWALLHRGGDARTTLSDSELRAAGVPESLLRSPRYVKSCMRLDDADLFDAEFFGYSPKQAASIDPQQRHFLECAWEALESAGYGQIPETLTAGVFGGTGFTGHLFANLQHAFQSDPGEMFQSIIDADKDFLTSRVAYKLGLTGPSITVQTACSTSLVAVHLACRSLLDYECDLALAGAASIMLPQGQGQLYTEGGIHSPDGLCRAFDAAANGGTFGSGVAIVVLRRLADALAAGDPIQAVIRSSAVNNDGSRKVGYTAPGLHSQVRLLSTALALAGVTPQDIGMLEAHGSGTPLGDSIELEALSQVYGAPGTDRYCALGSIKTNVGHLEVVAGVAGLIKTVLCLKHRCLVPSLNFSQPNALLESTSSPFFVNTETRVWSAPAGRPRRAGVSSFGIGGTNAHVILEEAPEIAAPPPANTDQVFPLSARDPVALEQIAANLADHLDAHPAINLADVAYTLQVGRRRFQCRRALVASSAPELASMLRDSSIVRDEVVRSERTGRPIVWLFPGQGVQQAGMAAGLYRTDGSFRRDLDECASHMAAILDFDIRSLVCEPSADTGMGAHLSVFAQAAIFAVEYCLANRLLSWGVRPSAVIGHSFGEFAAACAAGVFSLEDGARLVARRAQLVAGLPAGAMLVVCVPEARVRELKPSNIHIAAINAADQCVVAGETAAIRAFSKLLDSQGIEHYRMWSARAFHSPLMQPAAAALRAAASHLTRKPLRVPFVSCVTGQFATEKQMADPGYWAEHLISPVQFAAGLAELTQTRGTLFIEVGPGRTLTDLARRALSHDRDFDFVHCLDALGSTTTRASLLQTVGKVWALGADVDWDRSHEDRERRRLSLPTYPFERRREPLAHATTDLPREVPNRTSGPARLPVEEWFYLPSWRRSMPLSPPASGNEPGAWLILEDATGFGAALGRHLRDQGQQVVSVAGSVSYAEPAHHAFEIDLSRDAHYARMVERLRARGIVVRRIVHCSSLSAGDGDLPARDLSTGLEESYFSLLRLVQALSRSGHAMDLSVLALTNESQRVLGDERIDPAKGALPALCTILHQELHRARCAVIDLPRVQPDAPLAHQYEMHVPWLLAEMDRLGAEPLAAYRNGMRFVQSFERTGASWMERPVRSIRDGGFYALTGGMGVIGLAIAERLARQHQARLLLLTRKPFPDRAQWDLIESAAEHPEIVTPIRRIRAMEAAGAQVLVACADAADEHEMRTAMAAAERRFGPLNGVFHLAADLKHRSFRRSLLEMDPGDVFAQVRPKVQGMLTLMRILRERDLDFAVAFSSNAGILGGMGFGAYSAACTMQDSAALACHSADASPWMSIDWDIWLTDEEAHDPAHAAGLSPFVLTMEEGLDTLWRILQFCAVPQIVVSPSSFDQRLDTWVRQSPLRRSRGKAAAFTGSSTVTRRSTGAHVAPRTELERLIAEIWQEMLGAVDLGVEDHFLDLGGDSLIGLRILSRVKEVFGVSVHAATLIGPGATIAGLAAEIVIGLAALHAESFVEERLAELESAR